MFPTLAHHACLPVNSWWISVRLMSLVSGRKLDKGHVRGRTAGGYQVTKAAADRRMTAWQRKRTG